MASIDWTDCIGVLGAGDTLFKVTTGTTKPNGGGNFCRVAHSLTNTPGAVASYTTVSGFAPMTSGCLLTAALCRLAGGGTTDFSVFMFGGLQSTNVAASAYLLGLSDGDPCHIELRKGPLVVGLPDEAVLGANTVLRRSTTTVAIDEWVHLQLEVVVQPFGDVYLNVYQSDLVLNSVSAPDWQEIPGMERDYGGQDVSFIDDVLGINTGSVPLVGGRAGHGVRVDDAARRAAIDHATVARQTAP